MRMKQRQLLVPSRYIVYRCLSSSALLISFQPSLRSARRRRDVPSKFVFVPSLSARHTHAMNAREFHVGCHRSGGGIPFLGASRRRGFMYKFPLAPPSRVRVKVAVYPEYNESERDNPSETSPHEGAFPSLGNFFGGRGQMRTNNYCS